LTAAIQTWQLSKHYKDVLAVDRVDLRVEPGEIYGFLGLNGAGKTTTIRAILGMIRPTSGRVAVFGQPVGPGGSGPWRRVGHLVERPAAYPELTVAENLDVTRRLYGVGDAGATGRAMERFGLSSLAGRRAGTLSTGNLQRLGLARALLHDPDLAILDEPANGLDPAGVVEIRELLQSLARDRGVTVFMSSHILGEVDRLATRIGIIHEGRLIEELGMEELERRRSRRLVIDAPDRERARQVLEVAGYAVTVEVGGGRLLLAEDRAVEAPELVVAALAAAGAPPSHVAVEHEDLERHFLRLTGGAA
jgi:ABC-2 type transport system ATP-binding protein